MRILFTADLHFTDLPRDEYRWGLLPWIAKQVERYKIDMVVLGGDITDAKDKHSAVLVNKLVKGLGEIADLAEVVILRGNHDYIDENEPFFGFLNTIDAKHIIHFVTSPSSIGRNIFLPNTRNWEEDWKGWDFSKFDIVFAHATFDGALSETGFKLPGIPPSVFAKAKKVWSGDIHKPQRIGKNIEYVGAPYRCRFGDAYVPRVVMIDDHGVSELHYPCQGKHLIDIKNPKSPKEAALKIRLTHDTGDLQIFEGDQVKVRVYLPRSAYPEWPAMKAAILEECTNIQLTGPELVALEEPKAKSASPGRAQRQDSRGPLAALAAYCEEKGVPAPLQAAGEALLKLVM